jgi:hypothetical protein
MAFGMLLLMFAVRLSNSPAGAGPIPLVSAGFIVFNLLMNAGPNSTTFTLAPILFPTHLRATARGFAAGVAKKGIDAGCLRPANLKRKVRRPGSPRNDGRSQYSGSGRYPGLWTRGYGRLN